jgi:hypothetical protein
LIRLRFERGIELQVTPLHPLFVEGRGWVPALELKPGMLLRSDHGAVLLRAVEPAEPNRDVFNLEVGLEHTYRVSVARIWAHNNSYGSSNFAPGELEAHFAKHQNEWVGRSLTQADYLERARNLLSSDVGGDILGKVRPNGDILRYNVRTNEFAVGKSDGTIRTVFRPADGRAYWLRQ